MDDVEIQAKLKTAQINNALGVFIFFFGIIIMFAMFFTNTFIQEMTDMVAGLLLVSIGGGMIWKSQKTIKKFNTHKKD
ncbi:MAG: manganese efflux pump [Flavobacteriaceae bacterium]